MVLESQPAAAADADFYLSMEDFVFVPNLAQLRAPLQTSPATGTRSTTFTVRWAPGSVPAGYVVDVQRRAPGSSTWSNWRTGVTTASSTFRTSTRGTWSFRARLRRSSNGRTSGWSNVATVRVS